MGITEAGLWEVPSSENLLTYYMELRSMSNNIVNIMVSNSHSRAVENRLWLGAFVAL